MPLKKIKTDSITDDAITAAKIDDDGTGFTFGDIAVSGDANLTTGNAFKINSGTVLNATTLGSGVTGSSLTSVGTLTGVTVDGIVTIADYTLPSAKGTDGYVLTAGANAATSWTESLSSPTLVSVTDGILNAFESTGSTEDGGTLTLSISNAGAQIGLLSVAIVDSNGINAINATTLSNLTANSIKATWTGDESGYSAWTGTIYLKITKSGLGSNVLNTNTTLTTDPTISSVVGTVAGVTPTEANLGGYGTSNDTGIDKYTKLLILADRGGGTDIEDSSNISGLSADTKGHKITAIGGAKIVGTPFGDGKTAIFCDGSNDYVKVDKTDIVSNGGDWTMDFWVYYISGANFSCMRGVSNAGGWSLYGTSGNLHFDYFKAGGAWAQGPTMGGTTANQWVHYAVVQNSTGVNTYKNGVFQANDSNKIQNNSTVAWQDLMLGASDAASPTRYSNVYLDEYRISNSDRTMDSSDRLYTGSLTGGNFNPPNTRYTVDANTKLLIHSNKEDDSSDSNLKLVLGGNAVQSIAQYKWGGSSWLLDGSGDHIIVDPGGPSLSCTTDFTIEFWIRFNAPNQPYVIVDWRGGSTGNSGNSGTNLNVRSISGNNLRMILNGQDYTFTTTAMNNTSWHHVALVRNSQVINVYIDGIKDATDWNHNDVKTANISANNADMTFGCGYTYGDCLNYHLEDFRYVNGTAVYTGAFTPPTGQLTTTGGTYSDTTNVNTSITAGHCKLLMHGDGAKFTDSSSSAHSITVTGAYHSQGHKGTISAISFPASGKTHGSSGIYLDGGDRLYLPDSPDWDFGTGPFAIDFWCYATTVTGSAKGIMSRCANSAENSVQWMLRITGSSRIEFTQNNTGGSDHDVPAGSSGTGIGYTVVANTWIHFAITRQSNGYIKIFADGVLIYTSATTDAGSNYDASGPLWIGQNPTGGQDFVGYLDMIRYTKGVPRFTAAFTPPTRIYGAYGSPADVGTITITGATTDSTDVAFSETSSLLSGIGLTLTDGGGGDNTATITGTLSTASGTSTQNIRIQAKANDDDDRLYELNETNSVGNSQVTNDSESGPILFNARRYMGNASVRSLTGYGFKPDLIWLKNRDSGGDSFYLMDVLRGVGSSGGLINCNNTGAEWTSANYFLSFDSDGWTSGSTNSFQRADNSYIAWGWKAGTAFTPVGANYTNLSGSKNVAGGFSIVKFDDNSSASGSTFTHGLSSTPEFIITKSLANAYNWDVYTPGMTSSSYRLKLNSNASEESVSWNWNPTSTTITTGGNAHHGGGGQIWYIWHSVAGVSKFGTYSGGANNTTVCGFRPRWLLIKRTVAGGENNYQWNLTDEFRGYTTSGGSGNYLTPDWSGTEDANGGYGVELLDNGFSLGGSLSINGSGATYMFAAFA